MLLVTSMGYEGVEERGGRGGARGGMEAKGWEREGRRVGVERKVGERWEWWKDVWAGGNCLYIAL